ncbi:SH3 domain-containing protein [Chloroflexus sp.]|uniref:SH3 domain-containing protein n=1 Tax=Chloroflexus sp. TaxID=1904827 RepID=UPI00261FCCBD|nr:SH3 domain-containing protein [uncultured Chloroflexus sp.]
MQLRFPILWISCLLLLTGCIDLAAALPPTPSPFPTLAPLPTVTPVTPQPARSPVTIILAPPATATPTTARLTGRVNVTANLRSGPGTDFAVITVVPSDTEVVLEGQRANWYIVRLSDGQTGWMSAAVLDVAPEIAALVPVATP